MKEEEQGGRRKRRERDGRKVEIPPPSISAYVPAVGNVRGRGILGVECPDAVLPGVPRAFDNHCRLGALTGSTSHHHQTDITTIASQ